MRKIQKKNYYALICLIVITVLFTLLLADVYKNRNKLVSNFYNYANKITGTEFSEYVLENSDIIIYVSDKYDLSHESFEKNLENKLNSLNLKDKLIFLDKSEINGKFLEEVEKMYDIDIDKSKLPTIIVIIDRKVIKHTYITPQTDVNTVIDYEAFE